MKPPPCAFVVAALLLPLSGWAAAPLLRPWNEDVIYFALTDRFFDGDPENDVPPGSDPALYDKTQKNPLLYHGGDFRGLELALRDGYFKSLGVTAIWITPPVRNVWCSPFDSDGKPKAGYHGYWAQDFLDVDPHLVSHRSLDGTRIYPDTRDGRMQHYKDLVDLAHKEGIKIIQDIVCNHAGPVFYYDANGNGQLDAGQETEWVPPFKRDGHYDNAHWADIAKWDIHRTAPAGPVTVLGQTVKINGAFADLASYGRKGMSGDSLGKADGEEVECDFFSLRDFWTAPGSANFDRLVDDFVETYAFYAETIGVDGFRIDTIKHVHHAFWDAFTERLRQRLGPARAKPLILFGEVYAGNPVKIGEYTYRGGWPQDRQPCLDSLLNFEFCFAARTYLRPAGKSFGKASDLGTAFRSLAPVPPNPGENRPYYNPTPGLDGLNSERKVVNFIENHDGLNRFRVKGISERRNRLANALLLTAPGIPCLYYGTEASLADGQGKIGTGSETGRLTLVRAGDRQRLEALKNGEAFKGIAALCELRRQLPALIGGTADALWSDGDHPGSDDGLFAFARSGENLEPVIVVINASDKNRATVDGSKRMKLLAADGGALFKPDDKLQRVPIAGLDSQNGSGDVTVDVQGSDQIPEAEIRVGPETFNVFRRLH